MAEGATNVARSCAARTTGMTAAQKRAHETAAPRGRPAPRECGRSGGARAEGPDIPSARLSRENRENHEAIVK